MIDPQLEERVVLVTGGAGGIGAAIVAAFAVQGARVAVHYLQAEPAAAAGTTREHRTPAAETAHRVADEIDTAVAVEADLSEPAAVTRLVDEVEAQLGSVDVLVNNAAHCESPDTLEALSGAGLERHYRVNAIAPALLTSELARRRPAATTSIINISTDAARAFPDQIGYGTSKAALEALTRAAALDLAATGVRVNAIAPGPVQTGWMDEDLVDRAAAIVPMGRVGRADEIADAAVFLASHQARWITGQVLQVAGGHAL